MRQKRKFAYLEIYAFGLWSNSSYRTYSECEQMFKSFQNRFCLIFIHAKIIDVHWNAYFYYNFIRGDKFDISIIRHLVNTLLSYIILKRLCNGWLSLRIWKLWTLTLGKCSSSLQCLERLPEKKVLRGLWTWLFSV